MKNRRQGCRPEGCKIGIALAWIAKFRDFQAEYEGFNSLSVAASFPNIELHVILDNLSTHTNNEEWLDAHPNVKFHFTPTSASWINQVEVWSSVLQGQSLSGASFTSLKQLEQRINAYVDAYNDRAEPFASTKKKVRQRSFNGHMIPGTSYPARKPPRH
ncbi:hypothetical protein SSBR45G_68200 [Bradyrhizobium sp. SSBR45G]|nr:hypothetical protein SSBR45G_68200 [Bradyrhizobium sp. SSBR45G]GLH89390.1 hypothetical protein SSBR45R_68510 [Bradyrhizobium sp. SSBR45R]